ncbi:MAG: hypothetical protein AB7P20_13805 [Rhizobiaceae bacterium]
MNILATRKLRADYKALKTLDQIFGLGEAARFSSIICRLWAFYAGFGFTESEAWLSLEHSCHASDSVKPKSG